MTPEEFSQSIDDATIATPYGRMRKAVNWNLESTYLPPPKVVDDVEGCKDFTESVPALFDTDIESENRVKRWMQELKGLRLDCSRSRLQSN